MDAIERDLRTEPDGGGNNPGDHGDGPKGGPTTALLYTTPESLQSKRLLDALGACRDNGFLRAVAVVGPLYSC